MRLAHTKRLIHSFIHSFIHLIHIGLFNQVIFREVPTHEKRNTLLTNTVSVIGLLLIVYAAIGYNRDILFPGPAALIPVAGAVLLILSGPQAYVNRKLLTNKAMIWIGLISYPLYLWHWPILSFARIIESGTPSRNIRISAVILSFILTALTYYLIEKPIRFGRTTPYKIITLCVLAAFIGYTGYYTYSRDGLPSREGIREIMAESEMFLEKNTPWLPENQDPWCKERFNPKFDGYCRLTKNEVPTIQIIGDSHGVSLYPGLRDTLMDTPENVLMIGTGGCPPFLNVSSYNRKDKNENCLMITTQAIEIAAGSESVKTVILAARGPLYLSSKGFFYNSFADEMQWDWTLTSSTDPDLTGHYAIYESAMRDTLNALTKTKNVIFVLDNPELGFDPKSCTDSRPLRLTNHIKTPCAIPRKDFDERNREYRNLVMSILKDYPSVKVFDAAAQLCDEQQCFAMKENKMLYRDDDHLSLDGARLISAKLVKLLH